MKLFEIFASSDNIQLDKKTLVTLRWIAIVGQIITINVVYFILKFNFSFIYCCLIILLGIFTNLYLQFKEKKKTFNQL